MSSNSEEPREFNGKTRPATRAWRAWAVVASVTLCMAWSGCQRGAETSRGTPGTAPAATASATRITLFCGAGIRPAADELVKAFERERGVTVECDYDGSERLLARIKLTNLGDVYMPGDVHYVEQAEAEGLIDVYENACYFIPVILVQKGNPKNIRSLTDLTREGIGVGLGNPETCAIGRKSLKLLNQNGITLEDLDKNLKFQAVTVNDLGNHIKLGQLDAVIVWDAMAAYFADDSEVVPIPLENNVVSTVAAGVLTCSEQPVLAKQLVEFIASDQGRAIFEKHDFSTKLPSE